jgi:hypothetical protein
MADMAFHSFLDIDGIDNDYCPEEDPSNEAYIPDCTQHELIFNMWLEGLEEEDMEDWL